MPTHTSQRKEPKQHRPKPASEQKIGQTVLEDITRGDFQRTVHRDLQDIYQFYLDDATRRQLDDMGQFNRWAYMAYWVVKSSILKLNPNRRLLLLGSVLFFIEGVTGTNNVPGLVISFALLLLILLLELKDKLLAQDELATGRAVQAALMPKEQPDLPGWEVWLFTRSANEVGGDLVDYLPLVEDRLGVVLGDVAGKGLGAALLTAKLQSTLRAIAENYEDLAGLGSAVNQIFCRDGLPSRFVTLAYLEMTATSGGLRLLNAGHLPPLHMRQGRVRELPKGGPALGLFAEAAYVEQSVTLDPGDLLLVYSDGLTEARNEAGHFFGRQRLIKLLPYLQNRSADAAGELLLRTLDRFIGDARASDDLSLVVLRRLPEPGEPVTSPTTVDETTGTPPAASA